MQAAVKNVAHYMKRSFRTTSKYFALFARTRGLADKASTLVEASSDIWRLCTLSPNTFGAAQMLENAALVRQLSSRRMA
jgi:hypothetical protein